MNIKKILVAVDGSMIAVARLETGFNMAKNLGATVSALYVAPAYFPTFVAGAGHGALYTSPETLKKHRYEVNKAADEVRVACERVAENYQVKFNWIHKEGEIVATICHESCFHDILLLGKFNSMNEPQVDNSDLSGILLSCGKPCLVVPGVEPVLNILPRNIVFAWDGSREALQALHFSFPLLEKADNVMVVSVYKHKERQDTIDSEAARLVDYLVLHGVKASRHVLPKNNLTTGQVLVKYAEESESDMLVMGAYGHSRFREIVLGGATHHLLGHTSLPVLFAH